MSIELDKIKQLARDIKKDIESATFDERIQIVDNLYNKWIIKENFQNNIIDYLNLAIANFGLDPNTFQLGTFETAKNVLFYQIKFLILVFSTNETDEKEIIDIKNQYEDKLNKLMKIVIDAENSIKNNYLLKSSMTLEEIGKDKRLTKQEICRHTDIDYESLTSYQTLLMYLYQRLYQKQYKRYVVDGKGVCYTRIHNEFGYDTHAWQQAMTIEEFVLDVTRKDYNFKMWENRTASKSNLDAAVKELTVCLEDEFGDLVKDRHIFSFRNGIYMTCKKEPGEEHWHDQWIPYVGPGHVKIGTEIVSCKIFDLDFYPAPENTDWFDIIKQHCPNFTKIMDYQKWPEEVQRWMCILIGRMFYDVKELEEDWQVIPYLLGQAGSGKSTILENIVKEFYPQEDVGILSNNMEKKFGLSPLVDKKIFLGLEIKGNCSLEQAEFQSMISGEMVQINTKFKQARSERFKVPGILAGNEIPNYVDNAGSFTRRLVVFPFNYKVRNTDNDSKLGLNLKKELAYIMQACNKGYLEAIRKYNNKGIWNILPKFFHETKDQVSKDSNALMNFLKSDYVVLGSQEIVYCKETEFLLIFNEYCREKHLGSNKWGTQYYLGPFAELNLCIEKGGRRRYPNVEGGEVFTGTFILGVDIVNRNHCADVGENLII